MTNNSLAKITHENENFNVSGELTFATVMDLWDQSLPYLAKDIDLKFDFAKVAVANSAALALLLEWLKYANQHGKRIAFYHLPEQLQSIAVVSGVASLIKM